MSMETRATTEKFPYRVWFHDPEQVENLITLLEAKTVDPETGEERWKYGTGHLYDTLFPTEETAWEQEYAKAPVPKSRDSFKTTISALAAGRTYFGPEIPESLVNRFLDVMGQRGGVGIMHSKERTTAFWSNDKRIIAAGLVEYCDLSAEDVAKIFQDVLGRNISAKTVWSRVSVWRSRREFPYQENTRLRQNTPLVNTFVETLRVGAGITLKNLREWVVKNAPEDIRLARLDDFIATYEKYKARQKS